MQILASIIISAIMVLGSVAYTQDKSPALGASQTISSLTELSTLSQNDVFPITDTANGTTKKVKWGTATSSMKTIFDSVYSPLFSDSAGLAGLLSDETGSSGGFVRAGTPTISTPNITTPTLDVTGTDATGDIYYNGGSGVLTRLGIGAGTSYYLRSSAGGIPEWDNTGLMTNPQVASSTFTSTTTIEASNLTNKALIINGLAYQWPTTRNASSSMLTTDASGTLIWETRGGTTTSGTIANITDSGCTLNSWGDYDTNILHGLGATPSSITITAKLVGKGAGGDGSNGGLGVWDNNGNIRNLFAMRKDGGVATPVVDMTELGSAGTSNPAQSIRIVIPTATSTGFTFRYQCYAVTDTSQASTISDIKWTATR